MVDYVDLEQNKCVNFGSRYRFKSSSFWMYDYFSGHLKFESNIHDFWLLIYHFPGHKTLKYYTYCVITY